MMRLASRWNREWPVAHAIIGNPPFLGDKKMRAELGDKYVTELRTMYGERVPGGADLVTYWFERARAAIANHKSERAGLLATNSLRQQKNRPVLERIKQNGNIFMAWSDRPWILDGAAVRVSIVGFDNGSESVCTLDGQVVKEINVDLTSATDVTVAQKLYENSQLCFLGMMKAGPFDIDQETAKIFLDAPININGCSNANVIKWRLSGQNITSRADETWIIDFGLNMSKEEAALYELPFEYTSKHVQPVRLINRRTRLRERWWIYGEARPGLRLAISELTRCIVTPEVANIGFLFGWIPE